MKSCLYEGKVIHNRMNPRKHKFTYALYMLYLDLDEINLAFKSSPFWSVEKKNFAYFRRADYHGDPSKPLKDEVLNTVEKQLGYRPKGPIRMLTQVRTLGVCFNPVTFYYCYEKSGQNLSALMAEIENTPWSERYSYVLAADEIDSQAIESHFPKAFHVSPFFPMDMNYEWSFKIPSNDLDIQMKSFRHSHKDFHVSLSMQRKEITKESLHMALIRYPAMTWKVILGIYIQALKLWIKKVPFYSHPNKESQRDLLIFKRRNSR